MKSTMQCQAETIAVLLRSRRNERITYWACVVSIVVLALLKLNGSL